MSSMQIDQAPVFGRDSHVLDYWLANAEGFRVKRRGHWPARVQRVVHEPDGMRASALVVSSALTRRRRVVDAYAVVSVDPAARRLVLAGSRRARLRRTLALLAAAVRRSAPRLEAAARRGHELDLAALAQTRRFLHWLRPRAAAGARTAIALAVVYGSRAAEAAVLHGSRGAEAALLHGSRAVGALARTRDRGRRAFAGKTS